MNYNLFPNCPIGFYTSIGVLIVPMHISNLSKLEHQVKKILYSVSKTVQFFE